MSAMEINWHRIHERLRHYRRLRPSFADMIIRRLYHLLQERGICHESGLESTPSSTECDPNRPEPPLERIVIEEWNRMVLQQCQDHLSPQDVILQLQQAEKRESIRNLIRICESGALRFDDLRRAVKRFCWIPRGEILISPQEESGARASLIRNLLSDHIPFVQQAKKVLTIRRFGALMRRIIGPEDGMGRLGGTIAGLLFTQAVLTGEAGNELVPVALPGGSFLRSDTLKRFLAENQLDEYMYFHYCPQEVTEALHPILTQIITAGTFPRSLEEELRRFLRETTGKPVILIHSGPNRPGSSSPVNRDSLRVISANGSEEERLQLLACQLKHLFAASFSPADCHNREEAGIQDSQDRLAVFLAIPPGVETPGGFLPAPEIILRIEAGGDFHWELQAGGNLLSQPALSSRQVARLYPISRMEKKQIENPAGTSGSSAGKRKQTATPGYQKQGEGFILDEATHPGYLIKETQFAQMARLLHAMLPDGATVRFACEESRLTLLEALF